MPLAHIMTRNVRVRELVCSASVRCAQQAFWPGQFPNAPRLRPFAGPPGELTCPNETQDQMLTSLTALTVGMLTVGK